MFLILNVGVIIFDYNFFHLEIKGCVAYATEL